MFVKVTLHSNEFRSIFTPKTLYGFIKLCIFQNKEFHENLWNLSFIANQVNPQNPIVQQKKHHKIKKFYKGPRNNNESNHIHKKNSQVWLARKHTSQLLFKSTCDLFLLDH